MGTSLITKFADKFGVAPEKMLPALTATAFKQKQGVSITQEQMISLLVVANEYGLNPWTKEIYAFPTKGGGIVPIVGVDGWCRIINDNKAFNGMDFTQSDEMSETEGGKRCPEWMECAIHRKDREHPIVVREYIDEVYRPAFKVKGYVVDGPWQSHTKRMLRHKVMIQCARLAFGFSGVYDQDEGERILEGEVIDDEYAKISDEPVDQDKINVFVEFVKEVIDKDSWDHVADVTARWESLSPDEMIKAESQLKDKAPDSKKMYKSLLREYLKGEPVELD